MLEARAPRGPSHGARSPPTFLGDRASAAWNARPRTNGLIVAGLGSHLATERHITAVVPRPAIGEGRRRRWSAQEAVAEGIRRVREIDIAVAVGIGRGEAG